MAAGDVQRGLEDVVALESQICFIDGAQGRLIYRGYDIRELAEHSTFEEVAYLLWYGRLPTTHQLDELRKRLASLRVLPDPVVRILHEFVKIILRANRRQWVLYLIRPLLIDVVVPWDKKQMPLIHIGSFQ